MESAVCGPQLVVGITLAISCPDHPGITLACYQQRIAWRCRAGRLCRGLPEAKSPTLTARLKVDRRTLQRGRAAPAQPHLKGWLEGACEREAALGRPWGPLAAFATCTQPARMGRSHRPRAVLLWVVRQRLLEIAGVSLMEAKEARWTPAAKQLVWRAGHGLSHAMARLEKQLDTWQRWQPSLSCISSRFALSRGSLHLVRSFPRALDTCAAHN